jgi:hypothetical protein
MALIPRPTGFLENPLNQSLLGNQKDIAVATITDAGETNTNQIGLLAGSLQTAVAVSDDLELTSPARVKFQTDAVVRIGGANNLVVDGIPVAGSPPTDVLYYDPTNERVTHGAAPSSGSAWSTIPVVAPANMNMDGQSFINADAFNFTTSSPAQISSGPYESVATSQTSIVASTDCIVDLLPNTLTINATGANQQVNFNGRVEFATGIGPSAGTLVIYEPAGTEYGLAINYTAQSVNSVGNLLGVQNTVFTQTGTNVTAPVTARVGETFLAWDSQGRSQWLVQNPAQYNPNDMFPANTQADLQVGATNLNKFRTAVMGGDGLIYLCPQNLPPSAYSLVATIDPQNDSVNLNAYDIAPSNSSPRYAISVGNKIYHIPLGARVSANPFFFPIYDTITKTLDVSLPAPWVNGAGSVCGSPDATGRFIYMPPQSETAGQGQRVRKFDTVTLVTTEIGANYPAATVQPNKWGTACLAPNGNIYCFPFNARINLPPVTSIVLKIDTTTDTTSLINLTGVTPGNTMYYASTLSPDGNFIYVSPVSATNVLKFDWRTDTFTQPAGLAVGAFGGAKFAGITSHPNGLIYMFPTDGPNIEVIDPATDTFVASIPVTNGALAQKFGDSCLAPNGKIYCSSFNANDGAGNQITSVVKGGIPKMPMWMLGPGVNQQ